MTIDQAVGLFEASHQSDDLPPLNRWSSPTRPSIHAKNPDLSDLTVRTWDAIKQINEPPQVFLRGNAIVHATVSPDTGLVICSGVDTNRLRWWLTTHIDFYDGPANAPRPARPPGDLLPNLLATPNPPLPGLIGITEHPVFAADGTLQDTPGYSSNTQRIYAPTFGFELQSITAHPTPQEVEKARTVLLEELLCDFPFEDDPSRAHTLAALLLPFVRPMIGGPTPLHLIWKPKVGTGGTLLGEVLCIPSCGDPSVISVPRQEEERRRTLLATLSLGPGAILLDNAYSLHGEALSSCLTQTTFQDRLIGSSDMLHVPNVCLWLATGNNPGLSDEIARRTVHIHLDAHLEHPDLRQNFKHPLPEWAKENRGLLAWSALTLIQAWIAAGQPAGKRMLGKFESWSRVIGGILSVVGVPGFLERVEEFRTNADVETTIFRGFIDAWAEKFGEQDVRVSELLPLADALDLGNNVGTSRSIRLGKMLGDHLGQRFGEWVIQKGSLSAGYQKWRLHRFDEPSGSGGGGGDAPPPLNFKRLP